MGIKFNGQIRGGTEIDGNSSEHSLRQTRRNLKAPFSFSAALFIAAGLIGYLNGNRFAYLLDILKEFFRPELLELSPISLMLFIFGNNAVKALLIIPLGAVFAIPPIIFLFFNGFLVGLLAYALLADTGQAGLTYFMLGILPHGVIELTAVFISSALSFRVAAAALRKLRGGDSLRKEIYLAMRIFTMKILPMLLVAAFIEAFITPLIIRYVFPEPFI